MTDLVIGIVLLIVISSAVLYIIKVKKSGTKCIGCPSAGSCSSKTEGCGCGCKTENS